MKKFISLLLAFTLIFTSSVLANVQDNSSDSDIVTTLKDEIQYYIDSSAFLDAIQTCRELINTGLLTLNERRYYGNLIRELDDKWPTFKDTKLRNILDSYLYDNSYLEAIEFCETTLENKNLSEVDRKYFEQSLTDTKDKFDKYINTSFDSKITSYVNSNLYDEAIQLCENLLNNTYTPEKHREYISQKLSYVKSKRTTYKKNDYSTKISSYISSKSYKDAINLCNDFLKIDYISDAEKSNIETTIEDLKNKSAEYYTKELKPNIQFYMNSKLYIETIQTCETALNKIWLSAEETIYLNTTLNEAKSKYNEYRANDVISKVDSYISSKLYVEAIQLCEEVIGMSFLSSDNNKYLKQKLSEARSKYNAYRIKNQKSKAESFMKSKSYVETIQTCEEALSWSFLSSEEKKYFQSMKRTAEDKYSSYLASIREVRREICYACNGHMIVLCSKCDGSGKVESGSRYNFPSSVPDNGIVDAWDLIPLFPTKTYSSCSACGGSGIKSCGTCSGDGIIYRTYYRQ